MKQDKSRFYRNPRIREAKFRELFRDKFLALEEFENLATARKPTAA